MDFNYVVDHVVAALDKADIRFALIGGFAMALRGVQRATVDLDFILMLDDLEKADRIFAGAGYTRTYRSDNVSHYESEMAVLGRIDILHAFRASSLSMLDRADRLRVTDQTSLPVVQAEDLIGLKVQSARNDPKRLASDWNDIQILVQLFAREKRPLDWALIADYLDILGQSDHLSMIKDWYGEADG